MDNCVKMLPPVPILLMRKYRKMGELLLEFPETYRRVSPAPPLVDAWAPPVPQSCTCIFITPLTWSEFWHLPRGTCQNSRGSDN